jgi:chromosome segregation ATPase
MASGIYQLTFNNSQTYVGKSVDLERRWQQHTDKLSKGTAAREMLQAYYASDHYYPRAEVLLESHADLLDEYENYFINLLQPSLNTQRPPPRTEQEQLALIRHANEGRAHYSVPTIMIALENVNCKTVELEDKVEQLEESLESLDTDYRTLDEAWEDRALQVVRKTQKFRELESSQSSLKAEVEGLRLFRYKVENCNWWQRLWRQW